MADISEQDMLRMQADALRRVQEMQKRSQSYTESSNKNQNRAGNPGNNPQNFRNNASKPAVQETSHSRNIRTESTPPEPISTEEPTAAPSPNETRENRGPLAGLLPGGLNLDNDKLLLLGLMFLLWREGGDTRLLLALLYLMW